MFMRRSQKLQTTKCLALQHIKFSASTLSIETANIRRSRTNFHWSTSNNSEATHRFGSNMVLLISGATGTGKTGLSIELAKRLNGEIINVDSVQMYHECTIGSNKISKDEMQNIPHHLIDNVSLKQCAHDVQHQYTVHHFYKDAHNLCSEILSRNRIPILVGGSAYYIDAFINGVVPEHSQPQTISLLSRDDSSKISSTEWDRRYKILQELDPEYASKIHRNDLYRLNRAYHIVTTTGKTMKQYKYGELNCKSIENNLDIRGAILYLDRYKLYPRLEKRCEELVELGLIEEVYGLLQQGILLDHTVPYRAIGYRQTIDFINKVKTLKKGSSFDSSLKYCFLQFLSEFKQATRKYSKHQNTWFKKDNEYYEWMEPEKFGLSLSAMTNYVIDNIVNVSQEDFKKRVQSEEQTILKQKACRAENEVVKESTAKEKTKRTTFLVKSKVNDMNRLYVYKDDRILVHRLNQIKRLLFTNV
ncbi:hypothetical protein C9374_009896 [Naegleria lovaniensis]|uniref:tRNA dimethylallyltransferase n=1 Tax=Naegleria lovaniensis TaxID=51637 RepID=A0AA88KER7_NAELO|nr:uncharacterized protein C9374_009896 [Naegleria lovaniensis]KAG2375273.1 hypothetical protein C9374_009896 [Naegleria lovaniensis]